jgi:hypothetical protein
LAYFTLMASVSMSEVDAFRQDPTPQLRPSLVSGASHLLGNWVKVSPLAVLLKDAIDGGEVLHRCLWHPLRPPMFHHPARVRFLAEQIGKEWDEVKGQLRQDDGGWLLAEISRLLRLYQHAANVEESVVTALDSPAEEERARRVRIPWKAP